MPDFRDYDFGEFLTDLLKSLLADHSLGPGAKRVVYAGSSHDSRFQGGQFLEQLIVFAHSNKLCRFVNATPRELPILEEVVRCGHAALEVSGREQSPILSVFRQS